MANDKVVTKLCNWKPMSTRLPGRPKPKWENDLKEYLIIIKINNWTKVVQARVK
jgi:hypothetical protein